MKQSQGNTPNAFGYGSNDTKAARNNKSKATPAGSNPAILGKTRATRISASDGHNATQNMRSHSAHPGKVKV